MSDTSNSQSRAEKADQLMTVVSGWAAIVLGLLGWHRLVAVGAIDWWSRAGLILSLGLFVMWVWGYWPEIATRVRNWVRGGGVNNAAIAIGLVVALIFVNAMVRRRLVVKWDLTKNQRFTLAPRTREILKGLSEPVKATVFIPAGRSTSRARDLFKQYEDASPNFQWQHIDPLVEQTKLLAMQPPPKLNSMDLTGAVLQYKGKRQDLTEFTEKAVTSAILKMTRDTTRRILFVQGHGEPPVETAAGAEPTKSIQELLGNLREVDWKIEGINLYGKDVKVPDPADVALMVIAGPERPLAPQEAKIVNEYLNKGGRLLLMLNPGGPNYAEFLKDWGIKTGDDIVLDRSQDGLVLVQADQNSHEAVRPGQRVVFQPLRSVTAVSPAPAGVTVTEILRSGQFSETVTGYQPGKPVDISKAKPGAVGIAALAEKTIGTGDAAKKARVIVVGDSAFASDQWTRIPSFFNLDLAAGLVNYLGEEEALVSIAPKDENTEQAFLTPEQGRLLPMIHFLDFPVLTLLLAVIVYLKRR